MRRFWIPGPPFFICLGMSKHFVRAAAGRSLAIAAAGLLGALPAAAQPQPASDALDLDPAVIESSPVLQRWLEGTPDLLEDIHQDPAFRSRLRLGYLRLAGEDGLLASIEDVRLAGGLTLSADYRGNLKDRYSAGAELRYYLLPLGRRVNLAPVVGYRALQSEQDIDGAVVGFRLQLVPSRSGAADIAVAQTLVNPGGEEASFFTFSAGYAVTEKLRLGTDIQIETIEDSETQLGIVLEWLL